MIPFNKPHLTGKEVDYIYKAVDSGKISGNGDFTQKCQKYFERKYNFGKALLTTSCTDALEMAAILLDIRTGDEIIMPSFTFVSTALAFVRQGARIVFCDSRKDHPGMDEDLIEKLITPKTKAIVPVHYAGVACNMDKIIDVANRYNLFVVEDAAHAVESFFTNSDNIRKPLGSLGHLAAFSFHETKNIQCGEGGMLIINDERFFKRSEVIWEKGTNRAEFYRGEVNKYGWVDVGSSFLPSEITAAFLWAQLQDIKKIQLKRILLWNEYYSKLEKYSHSRNITLPSIPHYATNNGHMFYLVCNNPEQRTRLLHHLRKNDIIAVFHYISLHSSPYYKQFHDGRVLPNSDHYTDCLLRLPLFYDLSFKDLDKIVSLITEL